MTNAHYQKMVVALHETIRIMLEIGEVMEKYGGWPAAFQTECQRRIARNSTTVLL